MFVLVSKKAAASISGPNPTTQLSARTQNACDTCRIRKAKCDGQTPCGRCRTRQLVCTTSRRHARATGPVTEEHLATLQEQHKRFTHAISRMAEVIKQAELRGFVEDGASNVDRELSSFELTELLERFAPEDAISQSTYSLPEAPLHFAKKRKLQATSADEDDMDAVMGHPAPTASNGSELRPYERFFATVQQNGDAQPPLLRHTAQQPPQDPRALGQPPSQPLTHAQEMPFMVPAGSTGFDFHPSLVDIVDWDASLQLFLNNQQYAGDMNAGDASSGHLELDEWVLPDGT